MRRTALASVFLFASALLAQAPSPSPKDPPDLGPLLDEFCKPLIDGGVVKGLVVGVIDGDRTLTRGYGRARADADGAPDALTIFEIGSVSKVFTGVLLGAAVARGEVALDDLAQKWMPEGRTLPKTDANEIRLVHLSTHTSGLPRLPSNMDPEAEDPYATLTRDAVYEGACTATLRNEPGTTYEYSNLGAGLLGQLLVDRAGAASYEALLKERVIGPLSLERTTIDQLELLPAMMASAYDVDLEPVKPWNLAALAGAGGIRSTVADMLSFARAQWETPKDELLSKAFALARTKQKDIPGGAAIGLGWHLAKDGITWWHNGETGGFHSALFVRPSERRAVVVLCNTATGLVDAVAEGITQRLCGMATEPPRVETAVAVAEDVLQRYVGVYELRPGIALAVTLRSGKLAAQITGQPALRLHARSATEFFYRAVQATIRFQVEGETCSGLELEQAGRRMKWTRTAQQIR
ncbi:MAG: serine hydrolase domain-containing protein [Planctomycetota bacterium]